MLNWGIIGTGRIAYDVAYAINFIAGNKIAAVASRKKENAASFAGTFGARTCADYHDLVKDKDIDIVYIATPNALHYEIMKLCIENGKHVLCEKPFAVNAKQAEEIKVAAGAAGKFCMEAMWTQFIPSIRKTCELINAAAIGEIRMIRGSFGAKLNKESRFDLNQGGGALLDLGVYPLSLTYLFLGMPDEIQGEMIIGKTGVDEQTIISLKYASGAMASLSCSFRAELDNEFIIFGEKGSIRIGPPFYRTSKIYLSESSGEARAQSAVPVNRNLYKYPFFLRFAPLLKENLIRLPGTQMKKLIVPFEGNGYHYQIMEVNECLREKRIESQRMPLSHSVAVLKIMDEVRRKCGLQYPHE